MFQTKNTCFANHLTGLTKTNARSKEYASTLRGFIMKMMMTFFLITNDTGKSKL